MRVLQNSQYKILLSLLIIPSFINFLEVGLARKLSDYSNNGSYPKLAKSDHQKLNDMEKLIFTNSMRDNVLSFNNDFNYKEKYKRNYLLKNDPHYHVGVIIQSKIFKKINMREGLDAFVDFFEVDFKNITVEFLEGDDFKQFFQILQDGMYAAIVKPLQHSFVDDFNETFKDNYAYCHLVEELSKDFNKTVLLWPCSKMNESSYILPSFEAISYAVKSITAILNWTDVDIFVGGQNGELPLKIASALKIKHTLILDDDEILNNLQSSDKQGKAIIVTSNPNDISTLRLLSRINVLQHTKVLLIDVVATAFNAHNSFYKHLSRTKADTSNILFLSVLSHKYRQFLSVAFDEKDFEFIRDFKKMLHWDKLNLLLPTQIGFQHDQISVSKLLQMMFIKLPAAKNSTLELRNECFSMTLRNACGDITGFLKNCTNLKKLSIQNQYPQKAFFQIENEISNICDANTNMKRPLSESDKAKIAKLTKFIDFFYFFDFLVQFTKTSLLSSSSSPNKTQIPKYDFVVLDIMRISQNDTLKFRPLLILEQHKKYWKRYITHFIYPEYEEWLYTSSAQLWSCGVVCGTIIIVFVAILVLVAVTVASGIALRNYFLTKRLSKGPNKIVLSSNDFVFPVDSRTVDEGIEAMLSCWLQQLQEFGGPEIEKPDLLKGSLKNLGLAVSNASAGTSGGICGSTLRAGAEGNGLKINSGSESLSRNNPAIMNDTRARYNGDLVQLKEIPMNGSTELKSKAMDLLIMTHSLRHENINPFIGWFSDATRTASVFEYCSRGSLQDVLIMDEIKLDWSFRLSLLTDLVRGMRYLHSSPLRVHGALSSRNCVVDARWVLKITDYGLLNFYEAQGLDAPERTAKELLWTAPELLRNVKGNNTRFFGTQMGDVFSFGIMMQEVIVRGEPYCMLSLSAEEILAKIKNPPPLIRPSVSKGAAPPEAINIMRQCWAEVPDMRPDFNTVYERFKMLNRGRKVNFVDTMFQMLEKYSNNLEELIRERTEQLDIERKKTEQLLNRMLPSSVAEKLKMGLVVDPEEFSDVTIYFSDIVGFTTIAAHCSPVQVVDLLNDLYTIFDATINAYNVYKVETIGDAYMVVSGSPVRIPDHAQQIATMALDLLHQSGNFNVKHLPGVPLQLRIGLHTGPCCAGVVGLTMPRYCLFGDTVNTASRMESTGSSWRIHMSQETRNRLEAVGGYMIEPRGLTEIKGKGMMNTFWLLGKKGFEKPLPIPPPIGLDEWLIRNSISQKMQTKASCNASTSQSPSLAGELVEVRVEITPPSNIECTANLPNSYSLDSNSTNTISPNITMMSDFPIKTPNASPQLRKMSELSAENILNSSNLNRISVSACASSSRLYKKIEEMMDLSSPYNHYKCLSPSESNLMQYYDGRYKYGMGSCSTFSSKVDKPSSSRLLRRQFSLDQDDGQQQLQPPSSNFLQLPQPASLMAKSSMLEVPELLESNKYSPKCHFARLHKQNSNSIALDLEKIEEIPLSPASSQHHSSLDSSLNRSPPSSKDGQTLFTNNSALIPISNSNVPPTPPSPSLLTTTKKSISCWSTTPTMIEISVPECSTKSDEINRTIIPQLNEGVKRNKKSEITLNVETLMTR